jgi:hypothetical protein
LNEGRAAPSDTTVKPPMILAGPADEVVIRIGLASMALGFILVLATYATPRSVDAYGVSPKAFTGLAAACLGWFAVVLAHPSWGGPRPGRVGWLFVGTGIVVSLAVVIVGLDDLGSPADLAPGLAELIVSSGRAVIIGGLTWLFIVVVFAGLGFLWRNILAAGADRWVR